MDQSKCNHPARPAHKDTLHFFSVISLFCVIDRFTIIHLKICYKQRQNMEKEKKMSNGSFD